jgi:hypothetical protein
MQVKPHTPHFHENLVGSEQEIAVLQKGGFFKYKRNSVRNLIIIALRSIAFYFRLELPRRRNNHDKEKPFICKNR